MALIEQGSLAEILQFFDQRGMPLEVTTTPPSFSEAELLRMSSDARRSLRTHQPTHWASLGGIEFYGSGDSEDAAIRSAAKRFRIEQIGTDPAHD